MSRSREPSGGDVVPFGGDNFDFPERRPNQCIDCERSMSEKWGGDRCPFCEDDDDE